MIERSGTVQPLRLRLAALVYNRPFVWIVRFAVTLAVIAWILSRLDAAQLIQVFAAPNWTGLIGMVGAALLFVFLGGVKVWVLLRALAPVRLRTVLAYFVIATSVGSFTPAALGDFSIAALLRRESVPVHQGLSVMVVDRGISVSLYILVFTPLMILLLVDAKQLWWLPSVFLVMAVVILALNAIKPVRQFVRIRIIHALIPVAENSARTISDLLRLYPIHLASNIGITLLRSVVAGIVVHFALLAAGEQAPLFTVVCGTNFLTILNLLPISIGGLGIYEGSGVILFERLGLNGVHVLAGLVYQRVYILIFSTLVLALAWLIPFVNRMRRAGIFVRNSGRLQGR